MAIIPLAIISFLVLAWQASLTRPPAGVSQTPAAVTQLRPSPDLKPQQVVKIIIAALRNNDSPQPDSGIKIVYRFASPQNRQATGPLDRFTSMIKTPLYRPMLMPNKAEYLPMQIKGDRAGQHVRLTIGNRTVTYMIGLTKQSEGKCIGCWMTDQVVAVDARPLRKKTPRSAQQDDRATAI